MLSDDELVRCGGRQSKIGGPFGALVRLLALTGQRRDEVAGMRWDELDLDAACGRCRRAREERSGA